MALTAVLFDGPGEGSGWAPPGFNKLITIVINAYKRAGRGAEITSTCLTKSFLLAVVMYTYDMDLLRWANSPLASNEDLIDNVQRDVSLWGAIV